MGLGVALIRVFTVQRTGLPQVQVQGQLLQVQLPAIQSSVCPIGIYQDSKTGSSSAQRVGSENDRLYRQHLILAETPRLLKDHTMGLICLLENLGFIIGY